jgi:hypothetical protein
MTSFLLALALASTGQTGDTGASSEPAPTDTSTGTDTSAPTDTGAPGTDTGSGAADTATPATTPLTAASLAGETGGLGCRSAGRGPVRLGVLLVLTALLRRRSAPAGACCPHHGPEGHR